MQYVDVVVKNQPKFRSESYSYAIPPELLPEIKVGQLVLVDFHHSRRPAVIMAIKRRVKPELVKKLKPIKKIVCLLPLLQPWQIELARWLAGYYIVPLDRAVFSILPPPVKRIDRQPLIPNCQLPTTTYHTHRFYFLAAPPASRLQKYVRLARKAAARNKQILIILPHQRRLNQLVKILTSAGQQPLIFTSQAARTEQLVDWLKAASGQAKIILGCRGAVFAPLANPGLIIIDEPDNYVYKEETAPRFWLKTVARKIARQRGINLLFGDVMPAVEDCRELAKISPLPRLARLTVIDVSNQPQPAISPSLAEKIIACSGKILLYAPAYYRREQWRLERFSGRRITLTSNVDLPPVFALAVVLNLEADLNLPFYRAREATLRRLFTLGSLAKELVVQTTQPDNSLFKYLRGGIADFYQEELASRRQYFFPPFSRLIKLTSRQGDNSEPQIPQIPSWQIFRLNKKEILIKIPAGFSSRLTAGCLLPIAKMFDSRWLIDPDPYF